jgi:mono/diheme cytochrome c family protein
MTGELLQQPGSIATMNRWPPGRAFLLAAFVLFVGSGGKLPAQELSEAAERGLHLVEQHCARCHAIGRSDISPYPAAPPFRTLGRRYPLEALEEAFAEGLVMGHWEMPEFKFRPNDIGALIAYLKFVQQP